MISCFCLQQNWNLFSKKMLLSQQFQQLNLHITSHSLAVNIFEVLVALSSGKNKFDTEHREDVPMMDSLWGTDNEYIYLWQVALDPSHYSVLDGDHDIGTSYEYRHLIFKCTLIAQISNQHKTLPKKQLVM